MKKKLLLVVLFIFSIFQLFSSEYVENLAFYYKKYSDVLESNKNNYNEKEIYAALKNFKLELEDFKKQSAFKFDEIQKTENYYLISKIDILINNSLNNSYDKQLVFNDYLQIQNIFIDFCVNNDKSNEKITSLFIYVLVSLIFMLLIVLILVYFYVNTVSRNKEKEKLLKTILEVQENERERISRDLHDTVTQDIRSSIFFTKELNKSINTSDIENQKNLSEKLLLIENQSLNEIHSIIKDLTPPELEHTDFKSFLINYCKQFEQNLNLLQTGLDFRCKFFSEPGVPFEKIDTENKLHLFRIIQEALNNIQKHSKADECSVIFRYSDNNLVLIISDDGIGFNQTKDNNNGSKMGLKGMKTRAEILNAHLEIKSDDIGTEILLKMKI